MILGNDISEHQGVIDWNTYKNNTNFVIMRCGIGTARADSQFARNLDQSRALNIPRGFYQYCYPQYNTPQSEADFMLKLINGLHESEFIVLDFEEHYTGDVVGWCKSFLDRIASQTNGMKSFIYLNQSIATSYDWSPVVNGNYPLWIAAYTFDPTNNNFQTGKWPSAAMQQWTDKQIVPGISGGVDGDVFFGDLTALSKYGYHVAPMPIPSTPPTPPPPTSPIPPTDPVSPPVPPSPPIPPVPPQDPNLITLMQYKSYLLSIKSIVLGKGWWWTKIAKIKEIINQTAL